MKNTNRSIAKFMCPYCTGDIHTPYPTTKRLIVCPHCNLRFHINPHTNYLKIEWCPQP